MATETRSPRLTKKHEELTEHLLTVARSLRPGDPFPSQTELMRRFQVSDRTVLRSLEDLRRAGWIERHVGRGTFVADPHHTTPETPVATRETIAAIALSQVRTFKYWADLLTAKAEERDLSLVVQLARDGNGFDNALPVEALHPQGFVVFGFPLYPIAVRLRERGHSVVLLGVPPIGKLPSVPCVYGDHDRGGYEATRYLVDLGHRHLAYFNLNPHHPLLDSLRWRGHTRALSEARRSGIDVSCILCSRETLADWRASREALLAFFRRPEAPTAVLAWNDVEAMEVIQHLQAGGLRVPEDVSVIGFDNLPEGAVFSPALTTVDQHFDTQMTAVLDLLHAATPGASPSILVVPGLVVRDSCAPPLSARR